MFVYETIYFTIKKIKIYQDFNEGFEYTIKFKFNYIYMYRERERERGGGGELRLGVRGANNFLLVEWGGCNL